jgi:hypothetical protein
VIHVGTIAGSKPRSVLVRPLIRVASDIFTAPEEGAAVAALTGLSTGALKAEDWAGAGAGGPAGIAGCGMEKGMAASPVCPGVAKAATAGAGELKGEDAPGLPKREVCGAPGAGGSAGVWAVSGDAADGAVPNAPGKAPAAAPGIGGGLGGSAAGMPPGA